MNRNMLVEAIVTHVRVEARNRANTLFNEGLRLGSEETTIVLAEVAYRKALEIDPTHDGAMTNLGNLRLSAGDLIEAESLQRMAIAYACGVGARFPLNNLAWVLAARGELLAAVELFERAIKLEPDFYSAHRGLAEVLETMGQCDRARKHWRRCLAINPRGAGSDAARSKLSSKGSSGQ